MTVKAARKTKAGGRLAATEAVALLEPGRLEYEASERLQKRLVEKVRARPARGYLVLLEHPPTVTLGRGSHAENLLLAPEEIERRGIRMVECRRGGDVTYHGPGQLVGYPILRLARPDLHGYLRALEETLVRTLADFGVEAGREKGLTGVWTGMGKIAAIGVAVTSRLVTYHGFALNVTSDPAAAGVIVPCGIADRPVTSLAEVLGREPDAAEVRDAVVRRFGEVFGVEVSRARTGELE